MRPGIAESLSCGKVQLRLKSVVNPSAMKGEEVVMFRSSEGGGVGEPLVTGGEGSVMKLKHRQVIVTPEFKLGLPAKIFI